MARDIALRRLEPPGPGGLLRRWRIGKLLALAEVYVPYRLYEVIIEDHRIHTRRHYAVDAATGTLDPYEFAVAPPPEAFVEVETRNCHPLRLDEKQTNQLAGARARRWMFSRGFFRLANPLIRTNLVQPDFYIPYWAGFYGDEQNLNLVVLDAVRQTQEGSKVRQLIHTWLEDRPALFPQHRLA
ncbi:MAG TPA: hypothetical protein VKY85_03835 [Candidatus Angelobacter sp.]|nr:hypothetical protein [Candidatus Angelobacter sp.]